MPIISLFQEKHTKSDWGGGEIPIEDECSTQTRALLIL
jgi:hypothetical protein